MVIVIGIPKPGQPSDHPRRIDHYSIFIIYIVNQPSFPNTFISEYFEEKSVHKNPIIVSNSITTISLHT